MLEPGTVTERNGHLQRKKTNRPASIMLRDAQRPLEENFLPVNCLLHKQEINEGSLA